MTSNSISWLRLKTPSFLSQSQPTSHDTFKVLSVGAGPGDIDVSFLRELHETISQRFTNSWKHVHYVALEPNPTYCERLRQRFAHARFDPSTVRVTVHNDRFESFEDTGNTYDIVLFAQVLYYFENVALALQRARYLTRSNGAILVFHLSHTCIADIISEIIQPFTNEKMQVLNSTDVENVLRLMAAPYHYQELDAGLDVSECLRLSKTGLNIMSFCVERDLRAVPAEQLACLANAFREKATLQPNGRFVLKDPVGIFTVKPMPEFVKLAYDTDKVEDYRVLGRQVAWGKLLKSVVPHEKVDLKLLDVACGRGRWLSAFSMYAPGRFNSLKIGLDVLDISHISVEQITHVVAPPFKLNSRYVSRIQDACLDQSTYDVVWSMHGLYAVPIEDLAAVLSKMIMALRESGVCMIALATRKSFYLTMPEAYTESVMSREHRPRRMTSAEDVTQVLRQLGFAFKLRTLVYEERIDARSEADCRAYVVQESMFNSFNADNSGKLEHFSETTTQSRTSDEGIMQIPAVQQHLRKFLRGDAYYFPQEVQLISFGKRAVLDALPDDVGVYC